MQLSRALVHNKKIGQPVVQSELSFDWPRTYIKYLSQPFPYSIRNGKYWNVWKKTIELKLKHENE